MPAARVHSCTSNASKTEYTGRELRANEPRALHVSRVSVGMQLLLALRDPPDEAASLCQYVYFCPSKASKLSFPEIHLTR
jgi:hypothetical protein